MKNKSCDKLATDGDDKVLPAVDSSENILKCTGLTRS